MKRVVMHAIVCAVILPGSAYAQGSSRSDAGVIISSTLVQVDQCTRADELLRSTCARIGKHIPNENKKHCELPSATFNDRTSEALREFRRTHAAVLRENERDIASLMERARGDFDRRYADVRAGKVSMLNLEALWRMVSNNCAVSNSDWFSLNRKPGQ
jgi:hypothetical protein